MEVVTISNMEAEVTRCRDGNPEWKMCKSGALFSKLSKSGGAIMLATCFAAGEKLPHPDSSHE